MKILLALVHNHEKILQIGSSLERLGHQVVYFYTDEYWDTCCYLAKKIDKAGFHHWKNAYNRGKEKEYAQLVASAKPEVCLFINTSWRVFSPEFIKQTMQSQKSIIWFVDGVKRHAEQVRSFLPIYDRVFVFEREDIEFVKQYGKAGQTVEYLPVGYNYYYTTADKKQEKIYDVSFIGSLYEYRLQYLEKVAEYVVQHGLKAKICGPFYNPRKHFWKKYIYQRLYPNLSRIISNTSVTSKEAAEIYAASKICLNIHVPSYKGPNPRTFEIMATGSFELMDKREDYGDLVVPELDCGIFDGLEDCVEKLAYYLQNNEERESIAKQGTEDCSTMSMESCLQRVLAEIKMGGC